MKQSPVFILLLIVLLSLSACGGDVEPPAAAATDTAEPSSTPEPSPTDTPEPTPTLIPTETVAPPTETATPSPEPTTPPEPATSDLIDEQEAILILAPGNASRVTSPVTVRGEADPTFEQTIAVRIVTIDGDELILEPAMLAAELGERGPFDVEIPFSVQEETQAWIQAFASSARDGGITHLSSVAVTLLPEGPADIAEATPQPERIVIDTPSMGETVEAGSLQVSGRGLASFEQTLIVELLDETGEVLVMEPIIVNAPDLGQPGTFEIELSYSVDAAMRARLQVRDPSPAFGGDVHLSSVEIRLEP